MTTVSITAKSVKSFHELWERRTLVYFFVWRDLKSRYQRTFLGVGWILLQPLLLAAIFAFIASHRTGLGLVATDTPVFLIVFLGVSLWQFFETGLTGAVNSLGGNYHLLKKVYIPKPLLLLSAIVGRGFDFTLTMVVFVLLLWFTGAPLSVSGFLLIALAAAMLALTALLFSLLLAPLNVIYHDIGFALPFVMRVMFFATPLWYALSILPAGTQRLMMFSPIVAAIEMAKSSFVGDSAFAVGQLLPSLMLLIILAPIAVLVFRRHESTLVDHL